MPFYDLRCKCGNEFNIRASMSERESKQIKCPNCGNTELEAVYTKVNVVRSIKSESAPCPNSHICGSNGCCRH